MFPICVVVCVITLASLPVFFHVIRCRSVSRECRQTRSEPA
jgi:hypothetical protein